MGIIRTLEHDHRLLRQKLALLESALQLSPETPFVVRELSFSLLRFLQEHMRREADAVAACGFDGAERDGGADAWGHAVELARLRAVHELLLSGARPAMSSVISRLAQAIEAMARRMAVQERLVFPALRDTPELPSGRRGAAISGTMSVNEILQRYPQTERVFQELQVNRWREGYDSVDELAWRHGMDVAEIIEQLRHAAVFPHN